MNTDAPQPVDCRPAVRGYIYAMKDDAHDKENRADLTLCVRIFLSQTASWFMAAAAAVLLVAAAAVSAASARAPGPVLRDLADRHGIFIGGAAGASMLINDTSPQVSEARARRDEEP